MTGEKTWKITVETTSDKCPERTVAKIEGEPDQPWCKVLKRRCNEEDCPN